MKGGDISNESPLYALVKFEDLVEVAEANKVMKLLHKEPYFWKPSKMGRAIVSVLSDTLMVYVVAFEKEEADVKRFCDDNMIQYNRVVVLQGREDLDFMLRSPNVLGFITQDGRDQFGRLLPKCLRWEEI